MTTTSIPCVDPDTIQAGGHRRWHSRQPAVLHVLHGRVWVTASDRLDDHFVDAGASLVLPAHAQVLIGAETAARFAIDATHCGASSPRLPGSAWLQAVGAWAERVTSARSSRTKLSMRIGLVQ
jgi:hypothetical protein